MFSHEKTSVEAKYPLYLGLTGTTLSAWLTFTCAIAMAFFGYDQGVFAGIIVSTDFLRAMGNPNPALLGTIVSSFNLGCFFGALCAFGYGDKLGRRKTLLVGLAIMSIGAILQFSSFSVSQMIVARTVTGFGNGINTATAPIWQRETSRPHWRSRLLVFGIVMNVAGFSLGNWVAFGFSFTNGNFSWRYSVAFQLVFSVILLSTVSWLPESPKWLLEQEHRDEAIRVLLSLDGPKATPQDDSIVIQMETILESIRIEKETSPTWTDLLRGQTCGHGVTKRLLLGAGIQWMQQLVGINAKNYYLPMVLQHSVGLSNNLARLLAACNSVSYLLFSFFGLLMVEKAGRRKLLMLGATGQCICYILIPGFLSQSNNPKGSFELGGALTAFFFLYYAFFAMCWQGIPWLYPSEINSLAMQTKGAALGTAMNWLLNYTIGQLTPVGISGLGWHFYIIWAVVNAIFVPLIWLFYPETANRQLEDIDQLYQEQKSMVFVIANKEAIQVHRPERFIEAQRDRQRIEKATQPTSGELSNTTDTTLVV